MQLAHFYRDGEYFEKDLYESYLWYLIYNEFKIDFSIQVQQQAINEIQEMEKSLSKQQIENAKIEAEKRLGRQLIKIDELHKNSLQINPI